MTHDDVFGGEVIAPLCLPSPCLLKRCLLWRQGRAEQAGDCMADRTQMQPAEGVRATHGTKAHPSLV